MAVAAQGTKGKILNKIKALWEGGDVERLHAVPHLRPYTVAQHCWRMTMLLYQLHPCPHRQLVGAIIHHDCAERWVGDVPAPAKWWVVPEIKDALATAEDQILVELGVGFSLTSEDIHWLKALDILELYLHCLDEANLGNRNLHQCCRACLDVLHQDWIPPEITRWLVVKDWNRTDDAFGRAP